MWPCPSTLHRWPDDLELNGPAGSVSLKLKAARFGVAVVEVSTRIGSPGFVNRNAGNPVRGQSEIVDDEFDDYDLEQDNE